MRGIKILQPTRYGTENNSTFFEVGDATVTIQYGVTPKKKYYFIPDGMDVNLEVLLGCEEQPIHRSYSIPRKGNVGGGN